MIPGKLKLKRLETLANFKFDLRTTEVSVMVEIIVHRQHIMTLMFCIILHWYKVSICPTCFCFSISWFMVSWMLEQCYISVYLLAHPDSRVWFKGCCGKSIPTCSKGQEHVESLLTIRVEMNPKACRVMIVAHWAHKLCCELTNQYPINSFLLKLFASKSKSILFSLKKSVWNIPFVR